MAGPDGQSTEALFAPFWETWDLLHSSYVDPLDDQTLMEAALNGMMESLDDPHSFYMDPSTFEIINDDLSGEFEGIGASVRQDAESGALIIVDTLPDSPAQEAGLRSGDQIVQVDGEDLTGWTLTEIIGRIRSGQYQIVLGVQREASEDLLQLTVTRARIMVESVQARALDNGLVYIQLLQFGADTSEALHQALLDLDAEHSPGLILDMRGNPGGYLSTAVDVASEFLAEGVVVRERLRDNEREQEARGDPLAPTVPMVVLVDEGSASGSELVAGALQDYGRATLIGMPTYGKGSVQTWRELSNGGGVRVTIARWYTPNDRSIQDSGVTPDVEVSSDPTGEGPDAQLEAAIDWLLERAVETVQRP
jgi:carboxyl-terminal processing protease